LSRRRDHPVGPGREAEEPTGFDSEGWLAGLDPIGWRFGLDRIEALLTELGDPQHRFESVHVVGTNGKSSVAVMIAALVEARGRSAGAYLSPHSDRWSQRVRVRGREVDRDAFAAAAGRVADAVPVVERSFAEGERITQFEASTAAAFVALAEAGVEVGVIEAGLGGRLDATNVLRSKATVLTSIGLDHTAWLGETELEIAAEKLAVLREGTTLILGPVSDEVRELARDTASDRRCDVIEPGDAPATVALAAPYLRRNLAVALAAARVVAGEVAPEQLESALGALDLAGRFEVVAGDPPLVLDAAHNPAGAEALAEALSERLPSQPVVACFAILADKDAEGIVRALAPALAAAVCTEIPAERLRGSGRPGTAAVPAAELVRLCDAASVPATAHADPTGAVALARALASERGGVALIAGSHYLLGYGWTAKPAQSSSR
jgi:dihydrofolate synthase/folylpolyglutamate synthase